MQLTISPSSPLPLYYQIREQLRRHILSGVLQPGDALPGEAQICAETGVSRMTARQALSQLASEGLVTRQRGRGTFVAAPKQMLSNVQVMGMSYSDIMGQAEMSVGAIVLAQEIAPASAEVALQLKLKPNEKIVRIERIRTIFNERMSEEISFFPYNRAPMLAEADLTDVSLYHFLEERCGIALEYTTDTIEISVAGAHEAERLELKRGAPIVRVSTLGYLSDETPIIFTQTVHRGDRFRATLHRTRQGISQS